MEPFSIALAAFLGLAGITYAAHAPRAPRTHVLCSGQESGDWTFTPGDTIVVDPPTCRFQMEPYHSGPLLFR